MSILDIVGPEMILDHKQLQGVDAGILARCLSDNSSVIVDRINNLTRQMIKSKGNPGVQGPAFASDPDFLPQNIHNWWEALRKRLLYDATRGSAIGLALPVAAYLYEAFGVTCSKAILGCEMPTVPPAWVQHWLTLANDLQKDEIDELYDLLENAPAVRCDILYTLKVRLGEIAADRGILPDAFCFYPGLIIRDVPTIREFVDLQVQETGTPYATMKQHLGGQKMLRLVICTSMLYGVSPDYLLLQDYSSLITTPQGRIYDPSSRKLLSMLLNVDSGTRARAVGYVYAAAARRMLQTGALPPAVDALYSQKASAQTQVNVVAELSSSGMSKRKTEEQIIAALKPKMLEILSKANAPVSSARLFSEVEGHARLARKALFLLAEEGKIVRIPNGRNAALWQKNK